MKLPGFELPSLPSLPALSLPRLPLAAFSRRLLVRGTFVALILATLALAVTLLAEEKQRSQQRYEAGFRQTLAALAAQLRHPRGQLALLNASLGREAGAPGDGQTPLLLPFSALDFDDPFKARQAVEMSGCALHWSDGAQLCAAIGASAFAGGFVYLVASFDAPRALPRERSTASLDEVHRARLSVRQGDAEEAWIAPFEAAADAPVQRADGSLRGRLAGFAVVPEPEGKPRPDRDFRAWLWQDGECARPAAREGEDCLHATLLSLRVPVGSWREALFRKPPPPWPPADLARTQVRLQWLAPGGAALFDSTRPGASAPFSLAELAASLAPGESLAITRQPRAGPGGSTVTAGEVVARLRGSGSAAEPSSPWLLRLIRHLPVEGLAAAGAPLAATQEVATTSGRFQLSLTSDWSATETALAATATRMSWFIGAMLGAIALAWLLIEIGLMRRMALLTKRAAALSYNMQDPQVERRLGELEVADLRGRDELGILAGSLAGLLQRVKDGARREHLRAEQEREQWHAVGHEIMSPLQSLLALHGETGDPSHRYVQRMQQAVRVLYGSASPSEAIASAALQLGTLDLDAFLRQVAANAAFAGIAEVRYELGAPVPVRADEYPLEDAVTHVLRNADRHREPGSPIEIRLRLAEGVAEVLIHNRGEPIAEDRLERIFEYGVSDAPAGAEGGAHRGQGLFVARTYMAKMGGTIVARNEADGVSFVLQLPRA